MKIYLMVVKPSVELDQIRIVVENRPDGWIHKRMDVMFPEKEEPIKPNSIQSQWAKLDEELTYTASEECPPGFFRLGLLHWWGVSFESFLNEHPNAQVLPVTVEALVK